MILLKEKLGWKLIYCLFSKFEVKIDIELVFGKLLYLFKIDSLIIGVKFFWFSVIDDIWLIVILLIFIVDFGFKLLILLNFVYNV